MHGKTGTTVADGKLVAEDLAGCVDDRSGHTIAYAIILNDFGDISSLDDVIDVIDVIGVLDDEAAIANVLYEEN